jgi:hypothetical protein
MMVAQHILDREGTIMAYRWPEDTVFTRLALTVEEPWCRTCGGALTICDHRHHRVFTLNGPVHLVCKLAHCPARACPAHTQTLSPEAETTITMPWWVLGWDVVCWLGHRRFARHWSVQQLRTELADTYHIPLSDDAIERYIHRYQQMLAARHCDPQQLVAAYAQVDALILAIDGLQPEKGHETLYVVRELVQKRVWFAEALLSSATPEVQQLLVQARTWAERIGKPVRLWMSDKQDAFVQGIAAEFPGVPHRYCANHFLRDVAKPVLEADSRAKVKMRRTIRGLRTIEREVLVDRRLASPSRADAAPPEAAPGESRQTAGVPSEPPRLTETSLEGGLQEVVLEYCAAVRGILNDDQGGPLHPPGLRMAEALGEVRASLQRNLEAQKGGVLTSNSCAWPAILTEA